MGLKQVYNFAGQILLHVKAWEISPQAWCSHLVVAPSVLTPGDSPAMASEIQDVRVLFPGSVPSESMVTAVACWPLLPIFWNITHICNQIVRLIYFLPVESQKSDSVPSFWPMPFPFSRRWQCLCWETSWIHKSHAYLLSKQFSSNNIGDTAKAHFLFFCNVDSLIIFQIYKFQILFA